MKTISLRTFRVAVDQLTEPVIVVKREDGALRTLGTWTPERVADLHYGGHMDIKAAGFGVSRPAPKPGKRTHTGHRDGNPGAGKS